MFHAYSFLKEKLTYNAFNRLEPKTTENTLLTLHTLRLFSSLSRHSPIGLQSMMPEQTPASSIKLKQARNLGIIARINKMPQSGKDCGISVLFKNYPLRISLLLLFCLPPVLHKLTLFLLFFKLKYFFSNICNYYGQSNTDKQNHRKRPCRTE